MNNLMQDNLLVCERIKVLTRRESGRWWDKSVKYHCCSNIIADRVTLVFCLFFVARQSNYKIYVVIETLPNTQIGTGTSRRNAYGHIEYKQNFENSSNTDSSILQTSLVPLRLISGCMDGTDKEKVIVWQSSQSSSTRFCRPIRIQFKSTDIIV